MKIFLDKFRYKSLEYFHYDMNVRLKNLLIVTIINFILLALIFIFPSIIMERIAGISPSWKIVVLVTGLLVWVGLSLIISKLEWWEEDRFWNYLYFIPFFGVAKYGYVRSLDDILYYFLWVVQEISLYAVILTLPLVGMTGMLTLVSLVGATIIIAIIAGGSIKTIGKFIFQNQGNSTELSHVWRYGNDKTSEGSRATERDVYEHYHGLGSWDKRNRGRFKTLFFIEVGIVIVVDIKLVLIAAAHVIEGTAWIVGFVILMSIFSLIIMVFINKDRMDKIF